MHGIFNLFFGYVSSFGPGVLGKTVNACDERLDTLHDDGCFSVENNYDASSSTANETVSADVSSNGTTDQNCSDHSSESVSAKVSDDVSNGTTKTISQKEQKISLKTEVASKPPSNTSSLCDDEIFESCETRLEPCFEKEKVVTYEIKSPNDFFEKEIKFENDITDDDHHRSKSHTCASSDQQVPPSSETTHGTQSKQSKQAHAVKPKRLAYAAKYQNYHTLKQQTYFNYGIAGHIARNCVHHPIVQKRT
ncbi:hypothetical protein Hanom_Chr02g00141131 [Helianthus anomalus]